MKYVIIIVSFLIYIQIFVATNIDQGHDIGKNSNFRRRNKRTANLIKSVLSASSSSSSSSSSGHNYHDNHYSDHYSHESKPSDWWSVKNSILSSLFQASKALKGGAIIVKGKLIKGGGHLLEAKGKLLQSKGEKIANMGKSIVFSATQSNHHHYPHYQHYHHHMHHHDGYDYSHKPDTIAIDISKPVMHYGHPSYDYNIHFDHHNSDPYYSIMKNFGTKMSQNSKIGLMYDNGHVDIKNHKRAIQDFNEKITTTTTSDSFDKKVPSMKEVLYKLFSSASSISSPYLTSSSSKILNEFQKPQSDNFTLNDNNDLSEPSDGNLRTHESKIQTTHFY